MRDKADADKKRPVDVGARYFLTAGAGLVMIGYLCTTLSAAEAGRDQFVAWFLGSVGVLSYLGAIILPLTQMNVIRWRTVRDRDSSLHCARCDHVIDPTAMPECCPECGANLHRPRSIVSGNIVVRERRHKRLWLLVGMVVLLLAKYVYDVVQAVG